MALRRTLRLKIIAILGNRCVSCGNDDIRVLQLDHKNGSSRMDRLIGNDVTIYKMILEGLLSAERYQVLCANCNWIKRIENKEEN